MGGVGGRGGGGGGGVGRERTKFRDHLFKSFCLISNMIHDILAAFRTSN